MLKQSAYWGEFRQFKYIMGDKIPGQKQKQRLHAPEEHQVIVPVPALVSKELAEVVQRKLQRNKELAARHNPDPTDTLLRAGLVKCGHCGNNMAVHRRYKQNGRYLAYNCSKGSYLLGKCVRNSYPAIPLDAAAWEKALEIIRDPSEVDRKLDSLRSDDPTADRRKHINSRLARVRKQQTFFRERLVKLMMEDGEIDEETIAFLKSNLKQLAEEEEGWKRELTKDEHTHNKWRLVQEKVEELHKVCADMREQILDPNYNPPYQVKRELLEYLGIRVIVWKRGSVPRFEIQSHPPDIMTIIS